MAHPQTIDDILARDYPVQVVERGGRFFLHQPDFGLVVEDADLAAGYARLAAEKKAAAERFLAMGRPDLVPVPGKGDEGRELVRSVLPFAIKAGLTGVVLVSLVLAAVAGFDHALRSLPDRLARGLSSGAHSLRLVSKQISPERRDEVRADLRTMVGELKPFVDEVRPLLAGDAACPPPAAK